ncbi:MAG: WecB/TagA/CpsF family glycosyltransferase [Deltaproteobacteria bacterium]|nr:WecB/TagA/CpsF family glycosyltransferase [Deltaproteobacteria bacterium]
MRGQVSSEARAVDPLSRGSNALAGERSAPTRSAERVRIGQIWIDAVTRAGALDRIESLIAAGQGGRVFTPNVDHVVNVERDPDFLGAYRAAELVLCDGQPLLWASRILRTPLPAKVSGSDLVQPLLRRAGERGWRVFLLGGGPGVAAEVARRAKANLGVNVVGTASPRIERKASPVDPELVAQIVDARTQLLLVGLGAPKQELWIHRSARAIAPAVSVGVGASLDFLAGHVRRAPPWMSRAGLEWLFRLAQEPRRLWRRYLVDDVRFAPILLRALIEAQP